MTTKMGHRIEQAEIRIVIDILTDEFSSWLKLSQIEDGCRSFDVAFHEDCVRSVLQRMLQDGTLERRTYKGNYEYRKNRGQIQATVVDNGEAV